MSAHYTYIYDLLFVQGLFIKIIACRYQEGKKFRLIIFL